VLRKRADHTFDEYTQNHVGVHVSYPSHVDRFRKDSRWVRSTSRVALDTTNEMINRSVSVRHAIRVAHWAVARQGCRVIDVVWLNQTVVSWRFSQVRAGTPTVSSYASTLEHSQGRSNYRRRVVIMFPLPVV
jgi:hypothetical protein